MPSLRRDRFFYPIDWPQLSNAIRLDRAGGRCEQCGRSHKRMVVYLGDGRLWDTEAGTWRDGAGRPLRDPVPEMPLAARSTRVIFATAHRNHDTSDNDPGNLAAWCQRCQIIHDRN